MKRSTRCHVVWLLRRLPRHWRGTVDDLAYEVSYQLANARWRLRNPRMAWEVSRIVRLKLRGRDGFYA